MNGDALPRSAWRAARLRDVAIVAGFALPWAVALVLAGARIGGKTHASMAMAAIVVGSIALACYRWQRRDARWLVRALDRQRNDMEDSSDVLLAMHAPTALQQLQRERLQQRLDARPPDLRAPWPWKPLGASLLAALLLVAAVLAWPVRHAAVARVIAPFTRMAAVPALMTAHEIVVQPPRYTGLPRRSEQTLSLKAPHGTLLRWRLHFSSAPTRASLVFTDGHRIALEPTDGVWTGTWRLDRSTLYRIEVDGRATSDTSHRLEAIPDRAPRVKATEPARTLNQAAPRQRHWRLRFLADDDHGVASMATLRVTTAKGSGENVAFAQRELRLSGAGPATARRFAHDLDLAALGLAPGDEVVVRLTVRDNRTPQPHEAHSPSLILRLASSEAVQASDLEAAIKKVMPAYFRSQRQIIIDAEALLKQRRTLDAETFVARSDAIGVDQRILRLRYGQFLGEESEGGRKPPPTNDPSTATTAEEEEAGHDHADEPAAIDSPSPVGSAGDVLSAFGHTHDQAEAATLLDPETRATLKLALDAMWQSEGELRQGHPDRALPFAYRALGLIKQVQQSQRIYLARVGTELPPIDESRRMTGKRDGLASRTSTLQPANQDDAELVVLWHSLAPTPGGPARIDTVALQRWLQRHPTRVADPLALQAAIDRVQGEPDCMECRTDLRAQVWSLLRRPPAAVQRRTPADALGRRYLDALQAERVE